MTVGNHGASPPPEDDDPFAHLYRPDGGTQPGPAGPGPGTAPIPGVPRTSYTQVRAVGERTYGGQQLPPQQGYGQGSPHYAAPETYPGPPPPYADDGYRGYDGYDGYGSYDEGGGPGRRGGRGGGGRGGLMFGALAVVATVVIGIVAAVLFSGDGENDVSGDKTPPPSADADDGKNGDKKPARKPGDLPRSAADKLSLAGGAVVGEDPKVSADGPYVHGFLEPGPSATWEPELDKAGPYYLYVRYSVPGTDADLTLTVNGEAQSRPLNLANFAGAKKNDWLRGWTQTWSNVQLDKGANEIKISCESGNSECQSVLGEVIVSDEKLPN